MPTTNGKGRIDGRRLDRVMIEWSYHHGTKLTIPELSEQTGLSTHFLYRLRRNDLAQLPVDRLETLCNFLGCTLDELLWEEEEVLEPTRE